jgi:oligopeptide transport system ATP-binding protein
MEKILQVQDLAISYHTYAGEVQAVRGISFDIHKGEAVAIVGESGCGKSVTSKAIMGLIQAPQGEIKPDSKIVYKGKNIIDFSSKELQNYRGEECSIIFQDALSSLNPTMKVGKQIMENLIEHRKLKKSDAKMKAIELLKLVGIPTPEARFGQYPHEFSGGMRQRVMIAIALACNPNLLIADEPTTALDVTIQAQIIELIKDLQKKLNAAIILITHDLGVVADVADKVLVMYAGKIIETGNAEEIFYEAKHPYTKALLNAVPRLDVEEDIELESIQGTPPDLIAPPKGCGFSQRCKHCMKICLERDPYTTEFSKSHTTACWLYDTQVQKLIKESNRLSDDNESNKIGGINKTKDIQEVSAR